jgi:pimeloyl-ACP methyl ester carboxylesterase
VLTIIEKGSGAPIVLIPGIQGRWEYLRPTIDALAQSFRVLTFPLCGELTCGLGFDPRLGLENYVAQVVATLDARRIDRAAICGVSFGGVVAVRFAAAHPERAAALVLVSTPGPTWQLRKRHQVYARIPWVFGPLFLAESPFRLRRELVAAFPQRAELFRFVKQQLRTLVTAPLSLSRMAERARLITTIDLVEDCRRIRTPTLVVTGEADFDHVVPVRGDSEYARLIPGARRATLERTGHLGLITRPREFARLVEEFVAAAQRESLRSRITSTHRDGAPRAGKNDAA